MGEGVLGGGGELDTCLGTDWPARGVGPCSNKAGYELVGAKRGMCSRRAAVCVGSTRGSPLYRRIMKQ